MSSSLAPGPSTTPRPLLPNVNGGAATNADVSNHCCGVRCETGRLPSAIRFGRMVPRLVLAVFPDSTIVNGGPECAVMPALTCQPLSSVDAAPCIVLPKG